MLRNTRVVEYYTSKVTVRLYKLCVFYDLYLRKYFSATKFDNNIKVQLFKYFQRFPLIDKDRSLYKVFYQDNLDTAGWIINIQNMLELYHQGNLIQNIFEIFGLIFGDNCRVNSRHEHGGL